MKHINILKTPIIQNCASFEKDRVIDPDYKFSCNNHWKEKDRLVIYRADSGGIQKLVDRTDSAFDENITTAVDVVENLHNRTMVSGGHTMIDLSDRFNMGAEALKSAEFSLEFMARIEKLYPQKKLEFMVFLNDLYIEQGARAKALNPYIIPIGLNDLLKSYSEKMGRKLDLHYCAEKVKANKFQRDIRTRKRNEPDVFKQRFDGNVVSWSVLVGSEEIEASYCVVATARMLKDVKLEKFDSFVGQFPLCSMENCLNGYKVAKRVYDLDLPCYFIFNGRSCF